MRHTIRTCAAVGASTLILGGCGGGGGLGSHTYIFTPSATGLGALMATGIYLTIVTPIPIPESSLDVMKKGETFVDSALGPLACSYSIKVHDEKAPYTFLDGQTVVFKVNGSNPLTADICSALQKRGLSLSKF